MTTDFQRSIAESKVVFIVGTGMSAFTTESAPTATWDGLIRDGADRVLALGQEQGTNWIGVVHDLLDLGSASTTINAANMVADTLKSHSVQEFNRWLRSAVGELQVKDDSAAKALLKYPFPILTTNYDTLLEKVGNRNSAHWMDAVKFQSAVASNSQDIAHLHGVWDEPDSVILTSADYQRIKTSDSTQALAKAISSIKSIVYLGFGSGLEDPNFSELLKWQEFTFPDSAVTHYRLCRESEVQESSRSSIVPVVYGADYTDLPAFLLANLPSPSSLVINEAGLARDLVQETRDYLSESMKVESVLAETTGEALIVPPVFLPIPHANFVQERMRNGPRNELRPLQGKEEVEKHDFIVVVGDEGSGLTTAIKWLGIESSTLLESAAPVFVRFRDCRVRKSPLIYALKDAAMSQGLIRNRSEEVPEHVLIIDDINPSLDRIAKSTIGEIAKSNAVVTIIGCPQGQEEEFAHLLEDFGIQPRVLFLGRMRMPDIIQLADGLAPGRGETLAKEAARVLESEGLRKTPMTVTLLLYLLHRGGSVEPSNQTGMINDYVSLLLAGVGDPHENESGLTEMDLQAILANLAESMIWDECPSLDEQDASRRIAGVLEKYSWGVDVSANTVLEFLVRARVLRRHGSKIEFARYSYFTLFAARRAITDEAFRDLILGDIFYYEPVAVRLAALVRTDERLLAELRPLLYEELENAPTSGSPFARVSPTVITEEPQDHSQLSSLSTESEIDDVIETPESDSPGSFGLVKGEMTPAARMSRTVKLASSILRDLDQVEQLGEKRELLVMTLELWGRFINTLSADPMLRDFEAALLRNLDIAGSAGDSSWREYLVRSIPAGTAFSGIESSLVSPKLTGTLNEALKRGDLERTAEGVIAALFMLLLMRPPGWVSKISRLADSADSTWILVTFFRSLCEDSFIKMSVSNDDMLDVCESLFLREQNFGNARIKSAHINAYRKRLIGARAQIRQRDVLLDE